MSLRVLSCMFVAFVFAAQALAGPGAGGRAPLKPFFGAVSKRTGKSESFVRDEAFRVLRAKRKISDAEVHEILLGEKGYLPAERERELVLELQKNKRFKLNTGLEGLRVEALISSGTINTEALVDPHRASKVRRAKTKVDGKLSLLAATILKQKITNQKIEMLGDSQNTPEYYEALKIRQSIAEELDQALIEYFQSKLQLLTALGIPFAETGVNLKAAIPYERLSKPLIDTIAKDRRFMRVLKDRPTLVVSDATVEGRSAFANGEIHVSLDILSQLH